MKRLLITIISAVLVAGSAYAYTFKYNNVYYNVEADGTAVTCSPRAATISPKRVAPL